MRRDGEARRTAILTAGLEVFSTYGLHGASVDAIAERVGISKTNLLYYFPTKDRLYVAVLQRVLDVWLDPLDHLDEGHDPAEALKSYIRTKMTLSRDMPQASRLFCLEIVQGAALLRPELEGPLRARIAAKSAVLQSWVAERRLAPHDSRHLIFAIWAITQHYADFSIQVQAVTGKTLDDPDFFESALANTQSMILRMVGLERA
jgi:TetR/AcrR family transcriptional regulator